MKALSRSLAKEYSYVCYGPTAMPDEEPIMPRILVLDDEPLITAMLKDWLKELGCETIGPAHSVRDALDLITSGTVDGAILDISLGNEDCYPVADALCDAGVPIAFATGCGAGAVPSRFKDAVMLPKPFDFEAMSKAVAKLEGNHAGD
jgi:CheY-like chemotaxis protein